MSPITALMFFLVIGCAVAAPPYVALGDTNHFQQDEAPINPVFPNPLEQGSAQALVDNFDSGLVEQQASIREAISPDCAASLCG